MVWTGKAEGGALRLSASLAGMRVGVWRGEAVRQRPPWPVAVPRAVEQAEHESAYSRSMGVSSVALTGEARAGQGLGVCQREPPGNVWPWEGPCAAYALLQYAWQAVDGWRCWDMGRGKAMAVLAYVSFAGVHICHVPASSVLQSAARPRLAARRAGDMEAPRRPAAAGVGRCRRAALVAAQAWAALVWQLGRKGTR